MKYQLGLIGVKYIYEISFFSGKVISLLAACSCRVKYLYSVMYQTNVQCLIANEVFQFSYPAKSIQTPSFYCLKPER